MLQGSIIIDQKLLSSVLGDSMGSLIGLKNIVIFSAVLLTIGSVSAQQAFAVEGQGTLYATEPLLNELWTIDPSNGDITFVGFTKDGENFVKLPSLAVHPTTGVMYAGGGSSNQNLYIVNPANGDLTLVGATNVRNLVGLDFRADGTLFAAVKGGDGQGGQELGIVNIANGDTGIVGSFGVSNLNSIAFFDGILYGVGSPEPSRPVRSAREVQSACHYPGGFFAGIARLGLAGCGGRRH